MGKTAAQLTPREKKHYRSRAREQDELAAGEMLARRQRALSVAREASRILKAHFGVTRVLLFGSLATQSWFHIRSDVDLAVEGLQREGYWRADCRLEEIGDGFEIDLVDLQTASPGLAQAIHRDGIEI
jgi:predicted nucleotidyltransferase